MGFEARVYIQGAGPIRQNLEGRNMTARFPTIGAAVEARLVAPRGEQPDNGEIGYDEIPAHYVVIQFSALHLDPTGEDLWLTYHLSGQRVEIEAPGAQPFSVVGGQSIPGVANLRDVLTGVVAEPCRFRADIETRKRELLAAEVFVDRGSVEADPRFTGLWFFGIKNGQPNQVRIGGVVRCELGDQVEDVVLVIRNFSDGDEQRLRLRPVAGMVEVWIRHMCNLSRPDPDRSPQLDEGHRDRDFILNYALVDGIEALTPAQRAALPVPEISQPGQVGDQGTDCQCSTCWP